jgi:hypothetical protein
VLANDTDPEGDVMANRDLIIVQGPANGSINPELRGSVLAPPVSAQRRVQRHLTPSPTARSDALGAQSNLATVTVTVTPSATVPVAVNDTAATTIDTQASIDVLATIRA